MTTFELDGVVYGVATCYDLRFPELFRALADAGADVVLLPASWGAGRASASSGSCWSGRGRSTRTCWVAACGQADPAATGLSVNPKAPTGIGYSLVADGFGRVRAAAGAGPETLVVDVDPAVSAKARTATGALANRRL